MKSICGVALALLAAAGVTSGAEIRAATPAAIRAALAAAKPGDTILVPPGVYDMGSEVSTGKDGTKDQPITLRCEGDKGYATLHAKSQIAFRMKNRHWVFRGIHFQGDARSTEAVVFPDGPGGCSDVLITDCKMSTCNYYVMKASRSRDKGVNNMVIEFTELFDCAGTGFDLVCGDNWVLRRCYVHDYAKSPREASYGIFLKGGGKNGIVEGCIVDGKSKGTTLGISFGGGLTGAKWLPLGPNGKVGPEHDGGIARNNIVVNTTDSAYHTNNAANCKFYNNLAFNCRTFQRQASYPKDPVLINNLIGGNVTKGASESKNNLTDVKKEWFVNPALNDFRLTDQGKTALVGKGLALPDNPTDFFGTKRDPATPTLGPVLPDAKASTQWVDRRK